MPAPTAAAEPDGEPPGVCARLRGLSVGVGSFAAKAVVVVLPATVAPACLSSITIGASARGWLPLYIDGAPISVGRSAVSMMSLMPTAMPRNGPFACTLGFFARATKALIV